MTDRVAEGREFSELYEREDVAKHYVDRRFRDPLWRAVHAREVAIVNRWLAEERPRLVVEVAPGPARVTRDLAPVARGLGVDASEAMLREARNHLAADRWTLARGDAARLPVRDGGADALLTFRFYRHFRDDDRRRFLAEWRRVLRPGGMLVFEALNADMGDRMRRAAGIGRAHTFEKAVYDELWTLDSLRAELDAGGFDLVEAVPVLTRPGLYYSVPVRLLRLGGALARSLDASGTRPYMWDVRARRR